MLRGYVSKEFPLTMPSLVGSISSFSTTYLDIFYFIFKGGAVLGFVFAGMQVIMTRNMHLVIPVIGFSCFLLISPLVLDMVGGEGITETSKRDDSRQYDNFIIEGQPFSFIDAVSAKSNLASAILKDIADTGVASDDDLMNLKSVLTTTEVQYITVGLYQAFENHLNNDPKAKDDMPKLQATSFLAAMAIGSSTKRERIDINPLVGYSVFKRANESKGAVFNNPYTHDVKLLIDRNISTTRIIKFAALVSFTLAFLLSFMMVATNLNRQRIAAISDI